jgi:hypothetical protein
MKKMKDEESGTIIPSRLLVVDIGLDEDGDPITSLVVLPGEAQAAQAKRVREPRGQAGLVYRALTKALLKDGKTPQASNDIPAHTPCVSESLVAECAFSMGLASEITQNKGKNQAFKRAIEKLAEDHYVGRWNGLVWNIRSDTIGQDRESYTSPF